jgi:hypothetical protein
MDFAIGLELQATHLHRGDNVTAAATNSEVNLKKRLLILSGSDPATRKTVPIEYKYGLFVVRLAMLVAAVDNKQE